MIHLKKLKKVSALILGIILMSLPLSAEASSPVSNEQSPSKPVFEKIVRPDSIVEVTINEYDEFMRAQKLTDEELINQGWTKEETIDLRNLNYEEELKKQIQQEKLNPDNYKNRNSISENINLSKELTPDELRAAAPKLNLRGGVSAVDLDKDEQTWRYYYEWTWSSSPVFQRTDIIGVRAIGAVNGVTSTPTIMSSSFAATSYFKSNGTWDGEYMSPFKNIDLGACAQATFGLTRNTTTTGGTIETSKATSGYGYINFNSPKPMERLTLSLKYGHATFNIVPSINVSTAPSLGVGFSFVSNVTTEASIEASYRKDGSTVQ